MMPPRVNDFYPIRVLGRILKKDRWRGKRRSPIDRSSEERTTNTDTRVQDLSNHRLARLETEILAPARAIAPADLRLTRIISAYVKLAITDPGLMTLISGQAQNLESNRPAPAIRDGIDRFVRSLEDDLAEVIRAQDRTLDPRVAVQSLLGIIHWGISSYRGEGRLSSDEAAAQITFLALHGLVSQPRQRLTKRSRRWHAA